MIPSENFNTVLYTGNQAANVAVTGVGFQPDLVWGKNRSSASNHWLFDSVRGINKMLQSDQTTAEETQSGVRAFNSFGFTLGTWIGSTKTNDSYVAWNWKAGGSAVSNTNGSITSSVSANPSAGFSIVTYTSTTGTIGHGLSQVPDMIIQKARNVVDQWTVGHKDLNAGSNAWNYGIPLNVTTATQTNSGFWNNTAPTSSVFSNGSWDNGYTKVAYCFHSVEGYLKVGSYVGNGNYTDGTFVHCGFRPAMVIIRRVLGETWQIQDTTRSPSNGVNSRLEIDNSGAEATNSTWAAMDFLSNGFKQRYADYIMNRTDETYIFIAFAESPFKHSNAR